MAKIRIFVVDDNLAARAMLKSIINKQEDMEVVGEGASAQSSMLEFAEIKPDVVLLKVEVTDGAVLFNIMTKIKEISSDTKVVICAATNADDLVIPATQSGAEDFIKKPYNEKTLLRTIRNAIK